ncbi:MAG: hypothetical protein K8R58_08880 [Bacteroidales bacterium]|nr:hypothetical protein [Bacteroidales bacterium]
MNNKILNPRFIFIVSSILIAALMRLLPHWPNFTPIAAIALFGGTYLNKKHLAFAVPFAALLLSDLFLGFHSYMIAVYLSFGIIVLLGFFLRNKVKITSVLLASLSSSVIFFLITNFAVWIGSPFYPQNFIGLTEAYIAGLPFLNNGILGDMFYNTIFFGSFYFAQLKFPVLAKA